MRSAMCGIVAFVSLSLSSPVRAEEPAHHELQFDVRGQGVGAAEHPLAINYQIVMPLFDGWRLVPGATLQIEGDFAIVGIGPAWLVRHEKSGESLELALTPQFGSYHSTNSLLARLDASASFYTRRTSGRFAVSGPLFGGGADRPGLRYDGDVLLWPLAYVGGGVRVSSESGAGPMLAGGFPHTRFGRGWLSASWLPLPSRPSEHSDVRRWLVNVTLVH